MTMLTDQHQTREQNHPRPFRLASTRKRLQKRHRRLRIRSRQGPKQQPPRLEHQKLPLPGRNLSLSHRCKHLPLPTHLPTSSHIPLLTPFSPQDMVATSRAFDEYRSKHAQFTSTREFQLLNDLKEAVESGDQDVFADRLFQFDQMQKLNKWQTTVLLRIKEKIESQDEDFS